MAAIGASPGTAYADAPAHETIEAASFDQAIAVQSAPEGRLRAQVRAGWRLGAGRGALGCRGHLEGRRLDLGSKLGA